MYEEITHKGSFKQVSPFFTLYRTSPYNLQSHEISPVCKGEQIDIQDTPYPYPTVESYEEEGAAGYEGAEESEEWSLECLQTTHTAYGARYLSPFPWRELSNNSRTGVCESRPLSMTDFGDSLVECDQAEQDFRKLSVELMESTEDSEKICQQSSDTKRLQPTPPASYPDTAVPESVQTKQMDRRHMDEVSRRLYKVLYGFEMEHMDSDVEDVSVLSDGVIHDSVRKYDAEGVAGLTNKDAPNSKPEIYVSQTSSFGDHEAEFLHSADQTQTLAAPSDVNRTYSDLVSQQTEAVSSARLIQVSHDSTCEQLAFYSIDSDLSSITETKSVDDTMLSFRPSEPENEISVAVDSMRDVEESSYELSSPQSAFAISELGSVVHDGSSSPEYVTDAAVLMTPSRASSPASEASVNELNVLAPDSPVPHFRPLSPLPPTVFTWETDGKAPSLSGQPLLSTPGGASILLAPEAEERPLTPMVPNKKPFGRPLSLSSDYSGERSISPLSLTFDTDDRASSPESVMFEATQYFYTDRKSVV